MPPDSGLTKDTAEDQIRTWLEAEGLQTRATPDGLREAVGATEWIVFAELGQHQVTVTARPGHPAIAVAVPFQLSPFHADVYADLADGEKRLLDHAVEDAGARGPFVVQARRDPRGGPPVFFIVRYLYAEDLTRQRFIDTLHEARNLQRRMTRALLDALSRVSAYARPPPDVDA